MKQNTPEIYTGSSGGLKKPSRWLASEDIGGKEVRVVIEAVERYKDIEFDQGRVEASLGALKFKGTEKRMILNSTNRKALVNLYGMETAQWVGKPVMLVVDTRVKMMGKIVAGLRIKAAPDSQKIITAAPSLAQEGAAT